MKEESKNIQYVAVQAAPATQQQETLSDMTIMDFFHMCLAKWWWFVLSVAICGIIAVFYILTTPRVYTSSASVLIKSDSDSGLKGSGQFSDIDLFQGNSNVNNEMEAFNSPALAIELVNEMDLNVTYSAKGTFRPIPLYGRTLPIKVEFLDLPSSAYASLRVTLKADETVEVDRFKTIISGDENDSKDDVTGALGDTLQTIAGPIIVAKSVFYQPATDDMKIDVIHSSVIGTAGAVGTNLTVTQSDKKSTVIKLGYKANNAALAEDVLSTLITLYNKNWVNDKNQIAVSTSQFINDRLRVIEQELGNVDSDISSYKSSNLIPDLQAASQMYMQQANTANEQVNQLNNRLYMCKYIRQYISNDENKTLLLPTNSGVEDSSLEALIREYNTNQLKRRNLVSESSNNHPMVLELDEVLSQLRSNIVRSVDNQITSLETQISTQQRTQQRSTAQMASNPTQAKYLLSVERQQKVKESLYLFLLQKREENELSQAFTAYNTRIIAPPMGRNNPVAPQSSKILLMAILLGLAIPAGIIYLMESTNNSVRGRKDLDKLEAPFLGEVPEVKDPVGISKRELLALRYQPRIKNGSTDILNEAVRIVRSNLDFMTSADINGIERTVVMTTSANPGSGKTFFNMNIAVSNTLKGKKVCLIDLDIRRATLSRMVGKPKEGITSYLAGKIDDWHSIAVQPKEYENLTLVPAGRVVPNPTELLYSPRLEQLIKEAKKEFDLVFVDCPPVEVVADTSIIAKWVDMTIFVVRAGRFVRAMLPEVDKYYKEDKLPHMCVLLNGTDVAKHGYGYSRYGYGYGYGYGYEYGKNK